MKEKYREQREGIRGVQTFWGIGEAVLWWGRQSRRWGGPLRKLRCVHGTFGVEGRRAQRTVCAAIYSGFQTR